MESQLIQYAPVLILLIAAVLFAAGTLLLSHFAGLLAARRGKRTATKDIPYECGMLPVGEGSTRLSVKFYLVAMLFILFDIEVVLLYPWAVVYKEMLADAGTRNMILVSMLVFLGILSIGHYYVTRKGAFEWKD
jgi:NADH-quinone oxidoreductase subunit A